MHPRPSRVLGYARVSSDTQERSGTSLDGQQQEIARHCAALGWPAPRFYVEAESGAGEKVEARVQQRALTQEARAGDVVVVTRQDRWSRDVVYFLESVRELAKRGVGFFSLSEPFDRATPAGMFAATNVAAMSEFERMSIRARTEGARHALRNAGCWSEGVAPFGYRRDPTTRRLVVQPEEAAHVRSVHTMCIAGDALPAIAQWLCDAGVGRVGGRPIKWDRKAVHKLLRARWYLGEIRRTDGTWMPAHEAIVPPDVFEQTQLALHARRKGGRSPSSSSRTATWLLRGLANCSTCGARMGAAYSRSDAPSGYYVCGGRMRRSGPSTDCDEPYARVPLVDAEAGRQVLRRLEELRQELAEARIDGAAKPADATRLESLTTALASARQRRDRALELAVDGFLSKDELRTKLDRIDAEIARLESRAAQEERRPNLADPRVRAEVLASVERIRAAWARLPVEGRRAIVERLAERIEIRNSGVLMQWKEIEMLCAASGAGSLFDGQVAVSRKSAGEGR